MGSLPVSWMSSASGCVHMILIAAYFWLRIELCDSNDRNGRKKKDGSEWSRTDSIFLFPPTNYSKQNPVPWFFLGPLFSSSGYLSCSRFLLFVFFVFFVILLFFFFIIFVSLLFEWVVVLFCHFLYVGVLSFFGRIRNLVSTYLFCFSALQHSRWRKRVRRDSDRPELACLVIGHQMNFNTLASFVRWFSRPPESSSSCSQWGKLQSCCCCVFGTTGANDIA